MKFDNNHNNVLENAGKGIGFLVTYIIFTLIFFYILSFLGKIPESWTPLHASIITLFLILSGILINLILKS
tara:strand:+ start:2435 stop:2647 length:213 start_codon:yes stop_codon:yes gene_type:complete